ncbi:MAG: iron-sulfur cluster-binding domain-containing protein [Gammaproteobacteria bacterium]|nr:iron-sulfur cluster-binding domain-containing protein [Gammaproteobacteria bacterium]
MKVKGFLKDVGGASRVTKVRQNAFDNASEESKHFDPIGAVAKALHPGKFNVKLVSIKDASPTAKTLRFEAPHFPYFKAGQFLTLELKIGSSLVTRPYSISSAPYETRGEHPFVEITVRKSKGDGFACDYLYNDVKVGDEFLAEVGLGEFYYQPLRDAKDVVCLAGGSGVTPFVSMAKEIKNGRLDFNLTILFGSVSEDDIILKEELDACVCDKVKVVHVLSGENPSWKGEKGFLNAKLIKKYSSEDTTYFVCGPQVMYDFVRAELEKLNVPQRRVRFEVFGQTRDITKYEGFPKELADKVFKLTVQRGVNEETYDAKATESLAVALERAQIKVHTACRSGSCGFCRIKVLEGSYYVCPQNDGRRAADKDFNYVHACSTYPTSDIKIKLNIE